MLKSHSLIFKDFDSKWYKYWALKLKQTNAGKGKFALKANKFWQNAVIVQVLYERGALEKNKKGIGFGVGQERLPALFASLGVQITATDQDDTKEQATTWDNGQLAHNLSSLNTNQICPEGLFDRNVNFRSVDMTKIPKDLSAQKYDFLWSNCALGHLGSIQESVTFIEKSLGCLAPGGWAVHTTEVNVLSNETTLDKGETIFFRLRDIYELSLKLTRQGYIVNRLKFDLGTAPEDIHYTLSPKWGNDFSKLLFNGHMATQVVLIIKKPLQTDPLLRTVRMLLHRKQYFINLLRVGLFKTVHTEISQLIRADKKAKLIPANKTVVTPYKQTIKLKVKAGVTKSIKIRYRNISEAGLFNIYSSFEGTNPIAIATSNPINRKSMLMHTSWRAEDRPSLKFFQGDSERTLKEVDYIPPRQDFFIEILIMTPINTALQNHIEEFCLVKELDDIIPYSEVKIIINPQ